MTLQRRIFLSFAGFVLAIVIVVTAVSMMLSMRAATTEISKRLDDALVTHAQYSEQRGELLEIQARAMANAPHLKATLSIPGVDRETIAFTVSSLRDISDTDVLAVLDLAGVPIVDVGRSQVARAQMDWPQLGRAIAGESFASLLVDSGHAYHVAVAPIESGGRLLGVLLVGIRLDATESVATLTEVTGASVALIVEGRAFPAESKALLSASDADATGIDAAVRRIRSGGHTYALRERTLLEGQLRIVLYRDMDDVDSSILDLQAWLLAVAAAAVVLGLVVARTLAARILVPMRDLTAAAEALGAGDLGVRVQPASSDEVGVLACTFNDMAARLSSQQQELVESRDAAEAASREKSAFLARMSHEVRTPLNGMLGVAELLGLDARLDSGQRGYLSMLQASATNLLQIVNDVLDVSKVEAGQLRLDRVPFDLAKLVGGCVDLFEATAEQRGLELLGEIAPGLCGRVLGDATRLRQVLCNLLGNALKFTPSGHVLVRVNAMSRDGGRLRAQLVVRDSGVGIHPDMLERVFEPFQQEDESTTRRYGGTGLGLTISRQLVELMGGTIRVESEPGRGTEFRVEIEFDRVAATDALAEGDVPRNALHDVTVDVVTSSSMYGDVMSMMLGAAGARVSVHASLAGARDARTAVTRVGRELLVLDHGIGPRQGAKEHGEIADPTELLQTWPRVMVVGPGAQAAIPVDGIEWVRQRANGLVLLERMRNVARGFSVVNDGSSRPPAVSPADDSIPARALLGLRVLLVEDSVVNQAVAEGMLSHLGCSVEFAEDGVEAIERVFHGSFDVVLMDCHMPRMDGLQATREIRRIELERHLDRVPIVALTANVYPEDRARCREAGMDDYLGKPFTLAEMLAALGDASRLYGRVG